MRARGAHGRAAGPRCRTSAAPHPPAPCRCTVLARRSESHAAPQSAPSWPQLGSLLAARDLLRQRIDDNAKSAMFSRSAIAIGQNQPALLVRRRVGRPSLTPSPRCGCAAGRRGAGLPCLHPGRAGWRSLAPRRAPPAPRASDVAALDRRALQPVVGQVLLRRSGRSRTLPSLRASP